MDGNQCSILRPVGEHLLVPSVARVFLYNQLLTYTNACPKVLKSSLCIIFNLR